MSGVDTFAGITGFPIQPGPFAGETLQLDLACLPGDHLSLTRAPGSIKSDSASRELLQILTETDIEGVDRRRAARAYRRSGQSQL